MHAIFHVSRCKNLSFTGKDIFLLLFFFNIHPNTAILGILSFISVTAGILLVCFLRFFLKEEGGGGEEGLLEKFNHMLLQASGKL